MSIPIFYAYSIPAQDTRYLFVLFPFLSIIASFSVLALGKRIHDIRKILVIILVVVIISSTVFLYERTDFLLEKESYLISKYLVDNAQGVNKFYPESGFIRSSEVLRDFPDIPYKDDFGEYTHRIKVFKIQEDNLLEFIDVHKEEGLSHIVIDYNPNRNKILTDIFKAENNYPFLEKVMDTKDLGWKYHFKIFKINYDYLRK